MVFPVHPLTRKAAEEEKTDMVLETVSKDTEGEGRNREWIPSPPRQTTW